MARPKRSRLPTPSDGDVLEHLAATCAADVAAWAEQVRARVARFAALGIARSFIIRDYEHRVRIVVRNLTIVTVLPLR